MRDHEPAEMVEERGLSKGNLCEADKDCTQRQEPDMVNSEPVNAYEILYLLSQ